MLRLIDAAPTDPHVALAREAELFADLDRGRGEEALCIWESRTLAVVVGMRGPVDADVDRAACEADGVPIVRRVSGGGAVVVGPGCLNYSLVLSLERRPVLADVGASYRLILGRLAAALGGGLAVRGQSDLAIGGRKVAGSAQRRSRTALLHHGTLLYGFGSSAMERYLREPRRRPAYRGARAHAAFVRDLPWGAGDLTRALVSGFTGRDDTQRRPRAAASTDRRRAAG